MSPLLKRLYFPLVILFWTTMNVLLWRSEFASRTSSGAPVPLALVWDRILTAPDDSPLQLYHNGQRLGSCRWAANVGEELAAGKTSTADTEVEGRVQKSSGYTIDFEGNTLLGDSPHRLRFNCHAGFGPDRTWSDLSARLVMRPDVWEARASVKEQTLVLKSTGAANWERTLTFAELSRPETLLATLGVPLPTSWLGGLLPSGPGGRVATLALGLNWEARSDWLDVGHSRVRVYRLRARLLDKYEAVVIVSRVGEILRVELPDGLLLVNDAIAGL